MSRLWILSVLGLIAAVAVACSSDDEALPASVASSTVSATTTVKPTPTSSSLTPTTTIAPSEIAAGMLTYTDPTYGYSFDYPASWYLSPPEDNGGSPILYSYSLDRIPSEQAGMPVPKDKLKAFFWIAEGVDEPLEQWLADGRAQASAEQGIPPPTVISQSPAVLAGKQGLMEITESEGIKHVSYYIGLGSGRVFVVNAGPADSEVLAEFEKVLASVRFAA